MPETLRDHLPTRKGVRTTNLPGRAAILGGPPSPPQPRLTGAPNQKPSEESSDPRRTIFPLQTTTTTMKSKSWKTTVAGIAAILAAVSTAVAAQFDEDPNTVPNWGIVITAVAAGAGLVAARDNDKSSEQVGAKSGV